MFEMMLKSMGFDPADFKVKFSAALSKVDTFDARLARIEEKLGCGDAPFIETPASSAVPVQTHVG